MSAGGTPNGVSRDAGGDNQSGSLVVTHNPTNEKSSGPPKIVLLGLKAVIAIVFFVIFLVSSVLSKLTLLSLTEALRNFTMPFSNKTFPTATRNLTVKENEEMMYNSRSNAVSIYWQLLIILIVPNFITFLRCLFIGFLGKTRGNFPWPRIEAVLAGLVGAVVEVIGMCLLVFIVLASFPVGVSILLLNGVFLFQIALDVRKTFRTRKCVPRNRNSHRKDYAEMSGEGGEDRRSLLRSMEEDVEGHIFGEAWSYKWLKHLDRWLENWIVKSVALLLQIVGLCGFLIFWISEMYGDHSLTGSRYFYTRSLIFLPLVLLCMSLMWTNLYQERIASIKKTAILKRTSRYKSSLMNSGCRLFLYPLISYIVFRYATPFHKEIDPWCLHKTCKIDLSGPTLNLMIVHIVTSLVGYLVAKVACAMTLSQFSLGIPILLSTPTSLAFFFIVQHIGRTENWLFRHMEHSTEAMFSSYLTGAYITAAFLWVGGMLAMGFFICTKTNIVLARDEDMFLTPHYDSVFLEQHIVLNRQVKRYKKDDLSSVNMRERKPRMIFICSTMYRESAIEMKQMLLSIARVAKHYTTEYKKDSRHCDRFESHIFFDGAITGDQIENFGLQLLSLLKESLDIDISKGEKTKTPYGYTFSWKIGRMLDKVMPFTIHFKDRNKVKPKKRWSQVMYMNYVLKYRLKKEETLERDNTFILTTDADIYFTAESAIVLLDMMDCNDKVAAVSARTHPKGHGLVYWYQLFDYAIGHWFQKPAEHILGSVLCSPGCFSVFRCSALELVLDEYSTEATNASEFLMKDMGEDRWLCTLIIKQGLRLEYCAISEDYTYCPTEFDEFYKQRRRWIPSTLANLFMLVSESNLITRGNDSISILYILFQSIMIFSTAIAPATVVLVISAGLQPFKIPISVSIATFFAVGVVYGLICLYTSPKAQLDVAKLLTFFFTIIMALVIIGIFKNIVEDFTSSPAQKFIGPGDCGSFNYTDTDYEKCMRSRAFGLNSNNSVGKHFTMPVSPTVLYIGSLAATFLLTGVFHLNEITCLFHSIWFLLAMPSGYLLLLIYSAANVCDRSWGTREQSSGEDEGIWGWKKHLVKGWNLLPYSRCWLWCFGGPRSGDKGGGGGGQSQRQEEAVKVEETGMPSNESSDEVDGNEEDPDRPEVTHSGLSEGVTQWLVDQERECERYKENFERHGYTTGYFMADITEEDLEAIDIKKVGFRQRLMREIKCLETLPVWRFDFPSNKKETAVGDWLKQLELGEYQELFQYEGYRTARDRPALALLGREQLKNMGVSKRAHLQRLTKAIKYLTALPVVEAEMKDDARQWLKEHECECYEDLFTRHGYTTISFLSGIKDRELQEVGVEKKGLRLRLQKAAQKLPSLRINTDIPLSVRAWLQALELKEYMGIFHREGYRTMEDVENLKELTVDQLQAMGIHKTAHLCRLKTALNYLAKPSLVDLNKRNTKSIVDGLPTFSLETREDKEFKFWTKLIKDKLKPVALKFTQVKDVQKSLESLRNLVLAVLLLVNMMWIVLLGSLTFWQLQKYGIEPQAFQLLFLAVYGLIIIIQFFTMLAHRAVTLIHYLGRVKPREILISPWTDEEMENVSMKDFPL